MIWSWRKEKKIADRKNLNQQKVWLNFGYICSKLKVDESRITKVVHIRLTQQWSSFSRMMLWWSDCSASTAVLMQLNSNVKYILYDYKKEVCRSCFVNFLNKSYEISHENEEITLKKKHHKWQRSECGWKCFNLCTHTYKTRILLISFQ